MTTTRFIKVSPNYPFQPLGSLTCSIVAATIGRVNLLWAPGQVAVGSANMLAQYAPGAEGAAWEGEPCPQARRG